MTEPIRIVAPIPLRNPFIDFATLWRNRNDTNFFIANDVLAAWDGRITIIVTNEIDIKKWAEEMYPTAIQLGTPYKKDLLIKTLDDVQFLLRGCFPIAIKNNFVEISYDKAIPK